jgi:Skp family chaperone for outer membrane proteins
MKSPYLLAASGLAFCAFLAAPAFAQSAHVDANGMPTDHSTPAEHAETARLNNQISQSNAEISAQDNNNRAKYQLQQEQYQQQLQRNQAAQEDYQDQKAAYQNQHARYEALRDRYRAERAKYRRYDWPNRYADWRLKSDASVMQARVQLINGDRVGTVIGLARTSDDEIEGLEVRLDSGKVVWIDADDARLNRSTGQIVTNLHASDLRQMADERFS